MKKIIGLVIAITLSLLTLLMLRPVANASTATNLNYDHNDWYRVNDYMYFNNLPKTEGVGTWFEIESPDNTVLEYYDNIEKQYQTVRKWEADDSQNKTFVEISVFEETTTIRFYNNKSFRNPFYTDFYIPQELSEGQDFLGHQIRYYDYENVEFPDNPIFSEIEDLPKTNKQEIGRVRFDITNKNMTVQISFNYTVYYLRYNFSENQDMRIFETIEAYYMNVNKPQIIINNSDRPYLSDILEAPYDAKPTFVPHTIWDLETDKLETINKYSTYVYLKQNKQSVMMAYVYIDEFIIDKMLTATVSWTSRQENKPPASWIDGKYTEWERHTETLASDKYLNYKNLSSDWEDFIPVWNIARGIYKLSKVYTMPEIEAVNFNDMQSYYNVTKNELDFYFTNIDSEFIGLKENPRYKVWGLALQQGKSWWTAQTEMYHNKDDLTDPHNFQIIDITYETNGRIYKAIGEDMNLKIAIDPPIDGLEKEQNKIPITTILIFIAAIGLWGLALYNTKAFSSGSKALKVTLNVFAFYLIIWLIWKFLIVGNVLTYFLRL